MQPLRLLLDQAALIENWRALDRLSGKAATGAAVKADGYGLGAVAVTKALASAGCQDFFVAHWREAEQLAGHHDPQHISVLNGILPDELERALALGAKPVINTLNQARIWSEAKGGNCDLMIDSGINRLGIAPQDIGDPALNDLQIDICMSHLASADEDSLQNAAQQKIFQSIRHSIDARRFSLANSAGICLGSGYHLDVTRPGLSLYGGVPRDELKEHIKAVATPQAVILQIRNVEKGAKIGYNATYIAQRPMRLAIVSLGYADGYLRTFSNKGHMLHNGVKLPVIGRISMDLTIVDLDRNTSLQEGDWLTFDYDLTENAELSGLSQYELLTSLGQRYDRIWQH